MSTPRDRQADSPNGVLIDKGLLLKNSFSGIIAKGINIAMLIWLQQFLLGRIPAAEYSLYPLFTSVLLLLFIIKAVFTGGIARYLIAARAKDDSSSIQGIVSSSFLLNTIVALVFLAIALPTAARIDRLLTISPAYVFQARQMMGIMVVSFALRLSLAPYESGLIVEQRFVLINLVLLMVSAVRLLLLFVLLFGVSTNVLWVVVATETSNVAGLIVTTVLSRRAIPSLRFRPSDIRWKYLRQLLSFGSWSFVMQIARRIRSASDVIVLNELAGPVDVSAFYIGSMVPKQLYEVSEHATTAVLPSFTAMHETEQMERLRRAYLRYGRIMSWGLLAVGLPLVAMRTEIVALYAGPEYMAAAVVLLCLILAEALRQLYSAVDKAAIATAKMKSRAIIAIGSQLLNLSLTIVLVVIFELGAVGAAASTLTISLFLELPLMSVHGARLVGLAYRTWIKETVFRGVAPTAIVLPLLTGLVAVLRIESWATVFALTAISFILYGGVLYFVAATPEDRADMLSLVRRLRPVGSSPQ